MRFYLMTKDGGFRCGDTQTGRTAYAYPTSIRASAARRNPAQTATEMLTEANAFKLNVEISQVARDHAALEAEWMAELCAQGICYDSSPRN